MALGETHPREPGLLKPALLWLFVLAPFFFASYGFATWVTGQRENVATLAFEWERHIPFWAWTIVPYWSIDVLYGLSLLLPRNRRALRCHAKRLLTAQVICVSGFLLWPLQFSFYRPETDGVLGWLFQVLADFDKPFNQAPSLHIALLMVLWVCYAEHLRGVWRWVMHGWFALIGLSVLTTYQHHFIDVPTGMLVGLLSIWLWPAMQPDKECGLRRSDDPRRKQLAQRYAVAALLLASLAVAVGGVGWWLFWPAFSLLLVALNYALLGSSGFQKQPDGRLSVSSYGLLAPYLAAAWLNSRLWTRKHPHPDHVADGVWVGRIPTATELGHSRFAGVVDLCAELPLNASAVTYHALSVLDLTTLNADQCREAAQAIERLRLRGPLLVCCALGYSRSATAVAAWLLQTGRARTVDVAVQRIQNARPPIVLRAEQRRVLASLITYQESVHGH